MVDPEPCTEIIGNTKAIYPLLFLAGVFLTHLHVPERDVPCEKGGSVRARIIRNWAWGNQVFMTWCFPSGQAGVGKLGPPVERLE